MHINHTQKKNSENKTKQNKTKLDKKLLKWVKILRFNILKLPWLKVTLPVNIKALTHSIDIIELATQKVATALHHVPVFWPKSCTPTHCKGNNQSQPACTFPTCVR